MNKTGVVLHCRNTFLLNRFTVHSSRRTVIRIHEDFLFKRTGQVVFPSDKNCFVRQKQRPPGKGGNICSKVAISEEKKYKSQYQTDGEDECDKNGQETEGAEKIIIFQILSGWNLRNEFTESKNRDLSNSFIYSVTSEFPQKRYLRRFDTLRVYTKSFTRKTEAVNPVDKMCGPLAHFKPAFLSVYSKCPLGIENWVMWGNMSITIATPFVAIAYLWILFRRDNSSWMNNSFKKINNFVFEMIVCD